MILHLTAKLLSEKTHVNGFQETENWKQECAPVHFDDLFDDPIFQMYFFQKRNLRILKDCYVLLKLKNKICLSSKFNVVKPKAISSVSKRSDLAALKGIRSKPNSKWQTQKWQELRS